jgi:peptidase C10 family protein
MRLALLCLFLLATTSLRADDRSSYHEEARRKAEAFYALRLNKSGRERSAVPAESHKLIRLSTDSTPAGESHLFVPEGDEGFILVADGVSGMQVVGYSEQGRLNRNDLPEPLVNLMKGYALGTNRGYRATETNVVPVEPLLKSRRSQSEPFNGLCPYYIHSNGTVGPERCLVGCVATAIEGVFNYYRYPACLQDSIAGWSTSRFSVDDVAAGLPIRWEHILDDYSGDYTEEQARAVQELSLWCAMAAHMNFGLTASGASVSKAAPELTRVFGYETSVFRSRASYSPERWNAMLRHELLNKRPVVYVGYNYTGGGHCFVIDGQDAEGLYHLNWGYGGNADGYFLLDVLNPFERADDYTPEGLHQGLYCNQGALLLHPQQADYLCPDTLSIRRGEITVDNITFSRTPATNDYVPADVTLTNHGEDTVTYTFELFTYLPTDTAVYEQGIGAGVGGVTLLPRSTTHATSYCRFDRGGDQLLGVADEDTICYTAPLTVSKGTASRLVLSEPRATEVGAHEATFVTDIRNEAETGCSGNWVTYTLYYEDEETGTSHWSFAEIPAGETQTDAVSFLHLKPDSRYTLRVRYPWPIVGECTIHTPPATGISTADETDGQTVWYIYRTDGLPVGTTADKDWRQKLDALPPSLYIMKNRNGQSRKVCVSGH